jgi:hypothetical protein
VRIIIDNVLCSFTNLFPINAATMMEEQEGGSDNELEGESDNENHGVTSIISPDEMLEIGLGLAGYKQRRINRAKKKTNIERFKAQYGSSPARNTSSQVSPYPSRTR